MKTILPTQHLFIYLFIFCKNNSECYLIQTGLGKHGFGEKAMFESGCTSAEDFVAYA